MSVMSVMSVIRVWGQTAAIRYPHLVDEQLRARLSSQLDLRPQSRPAVHAKANRTIIHGCVNQQQVGTLWPE